MSPNPTQPYTNLKTFVNMEGGVGGYYNPESFECIVRNQTLHNYTFIYFDISILYTDFFLFWCLPYQTRINPHLGFLDLNLTF